jgi:hypothetical protein
VHRPRGGAALKEGDPIPQAWVPRVVNLALASAFLLFLVPLFSHLGGLRASAKAIVLIVAVPFVLLTVACLASAARPGSLGRLARRARARRTMPD